MISKWNSHFQWCLQKKKIVLSILITIVVFSLFLNYMIETEENEQLESIKSKCLFCNIANGRKMSARLEYENEEYAILKDKYPAATHHYLAIPKEHYTSIKVLNKSHVGLGKKLNIYMFFMCVLNLIHMLTHLDERTFGNILQWFTVSRMHEGMIQFLLSKGIREEDAIIGYHIPPFISQKHLHLHGISPKSEMSLSNRISFFMPSFWFKSVS